MSDPMTDRDAPVVDPAGGAAPCRRLLVLTVGTSLLSNTGGPDRQRDAELRDLNAVTGPVLEDGEDADIGAADILPALAPFLRPERVATELAYRARPKRGRADRLPQELSYLALLPGRFPDWFAAGPLLVALLASDSYAGRVCAETVGRLLTGPGRSAPWDRYTLRRDGREDDTGGGAGALATVVAGLQIADGPRFEAEGVPNLLDAVHCLAEEGWDEIVLNPTGGFKGAIPYSTLAGHLVGPRVEQHYLFEGTPHIIVLPPYPVGLDFPLWHRQSGVLDAVRLLPLGEARDRYRAVLDCRMRAAADGAGRGLVGLLEARYREARADDPLRAFSVGVLRQFLGDGPLAERLIRLVRRIGDGIWLGDKLPMGADHAGKHHHNLLELAQQLLTPIGDLLNPEERFVLLAAVLLHDCGHVLDTLPVRDAPDAARVVLFPTEVREYHHFLAYRRLLDETGEDDLRSLMADGNPLLRAVAWLCVYHRRGTGWEDEAEERKGHHCPYVDWAVPPPRRLPPDALGLPPGVQVDLPKLVALLRLIDGCDNQGRRIGFGAEDVLMRQTFARDVRSWESRVRALLVPARAALPDDALLTRLDAATDLGAAAPLTQAEWEVRVARGERLARGEASAGDILWLECARAFDELKLRDRQEPHLAKHRAVERIRILPAPDFADDRWRYRVELTPSPDAPLDDKDWAARHGIKPPTLRRWIETEVGSEMSAPMADYLAAAAGRRVGFVFGWTDREEAFAAYDGAPR